MRTVHLCPDHSSWWLLSPGITLFFDELCIGRKDYEKLFANGGQSSYHEQLVRHYERIEKSGAVEIRVIDDQDFSCSHSSVGLQLALELCKQAKANPDFIPQAELVLVARNQFASWIEYQRRRQSYLRDDEPFSQFIESELHDWHRRLRRFDNILDTWGADSFDLFQGDKQLFSTYIRAITAALRCIEIADKGLRIYDPMLASYMPCIELIERFLSTPESADQTPLDAYEAYSFRMARYGETVPVDISLEKLFRTIDDYSKIRRLLERVDETIGSVSSARLDHSFAEVKKIIHPLVSQAASAAKFTEYAFWAAGLKVEPLSWVALPLVTDRIKSIAGSLSLMINRVGRFSGAYATVVEQMILQQQSQHGSIVSREFNAEKFKAHYRDFGSRSPGDPNAV